MNCKLYSYELLNSTGLTIIIGILCVTLTSCDPMKHVIISNHTKKLVTIQIEQDTTNQLSLGRQNEITYTLTSSGDSSEVGFIYGFGMFSKEDLISFNSMIHKITIDTEDEKCVLTGPELEEFLPKRRLGLLNNWLKIKIENCTQH